MWTAAESLPAPEGGSKESPARMCGRIRKIYIHKSNSRPLNGLLTALTVWSSIITLFESLISLQSFSERLKLNV